MSRANFPCLHSTVLDPRRPKGSTPSIRTWAESRRLRYVLDTRALFCQFLFKFSAVHCTCRLGIVSASGIVLLLFVVSAITKCKGIVNQQESKRVQGIPKYHPVKCHVAVFSACSDFNRWNSLLSSLRVQRTYRHGQYFCFQHSQDSEGGRLESRAGLSRCHRPHNSAKNELTRGQELRMYAGESTLSQMAKNLRNPFELRAHVRSTNSGCRRQSIAHMQMHHLLTHHDRRL